MTRWLLVVGFVACVPAGNWLVGHVGTTCLPDGPCLLPVWPGLMAPSGVLVVSLALVLRDGIQEAWGPRRGPWVALAAIGVGAILSVGTSRGELALASALAFAGSEVLDWRVFQPLRRRGLVLAVFLSGLVGLVADSVLFLWFAFGSLDFLVGQVVGKAWALLAACSALLAWGRK